jgi:hypothetical protein
MCDFFHFAFPISNFPPAKTEQLYGSHHRAFCAQFHFPSFSLHLHRMTKAFSELVWDYLVFFVLIITSSIIPLWSQLSRGKQKTKADYVFATQGVSIFAMMLSIARGTLGVRSFLGKRLNQYLQFM